MGHGPHSSNCCVVLYIVCFLSFYVLFVCKCVLYFCHLVKTQLQLTNVSNHISTAICTLLGNAAFRSKIVFRIYMIHKLRAITSLKHYCTIILLTVKASVFCEVRMEFLFIICIKDRLQWVIS